MIYEVLVALAILVPLNAHWQASGAVHTPPYPELHGAPSPSKVRFWQVAEAESQVAQLETNTRESSAAKGLVERDARFFLPTELTIRKGRVEINGEVGWMFVRGGKDGWAAGVTTEIEVGRRFEVLGELHAQKEAELPIDEIVNVGARMALTEKIWLLAAVGTGVNGDAEERVHLRVYAGIQLNLPKQYHGATLDG